MSKNGASQLGIRIFNSKFVLSTVICDEFLSRINIVSGLLQSNSIDFGSFLEHLTKLQKNFQIIRGDVFMFDTFFNETDQIA